MSNRQLYFAKGTSELTTFEEVCVTLCAGRHATPASVCIFENIDPTSDFGALEEEAVRRLDSILPEQYVKSDVGFRVKNPLSYEDYDAMYRAVRLVVYITGYTPALVAVLNAANRLAIAEVSCMHFDRDTGRYREQVVRLGA